MHALLPAKVTRRTDFLAAVAVLAATIAAALALAAPAQANAGHGARTGAVSVAIDAMNPKYAMPGQTVTLTGTVTNGTSQAKAGLAVQLLTSQAPFPTRDQMDAYLGHGADTRLGAAGNPFLIGTSLRPGATARWSSSFQVNAAGITAFGVYPVTAQVADTAGDVLASERTLLPFWPGSRAAGLLRPLNIAWAWPLIDQPQQQACSGLTSNALAASLSPGGRLSILLAAGNAHPDADLTWFIDPALLSDVATMTHRYKAASSPDCTGAKDELASKAAVAWLSALRTAASRQQAVITSYANVDVTALVHRGLNADLASAFTVGDAVAQEVLHGTFRPSIAWPAGGTADLSVLTSLAAAEHIGTVVLGSSQMRPTSSAVFAEDAVTSIRTGAGTTMNVLLADDILTGVLRAGSSGSGVLPQSTEFAVRQRFLAETAMIAAEEPNTARSIVVAPPQGWSPTATLAGDLLGETASTPWLAPTTLSSLTTAPDTERTISRRPPVASQASPGELSRGYLTRLKALGAKLGVYRSMLYQPAPLYVRSLDEALAATESSAWRGGGAAQGGGRVSSLWQYLSDADRKVKIIVSLQVQMGGASGAVPVSIQNGLHQAIQVRLNTTVVSTPGRASQLTISRSQKPITVQPMQAVTVRLPVSSAPQGSTNIQLGLSSADGTPLTFVHASLTVVSTRYGRAILFLIAAAVGVLVLTSVYRAVRRRLRDDAHGVVQDAGPQGSVMTGTSGPRHPTEAPDDLADARRWADDA